MLTTIKKWKRYNHPRIFKHKETSTEWEYTIDGKILVGHGKYKCFSSLNINVLEDAKQKGIIYEVVLNK